MRFDGMGIEDSIIDLKVMDHLMETVGFVRAGQWDYERVTYDYKFENMDNGEVYYLRVQGYAIEGEVDTSHCIIKMLVPLLGRHYYPHGVEYSEENFPKTIINHSKRLLEKVKEGLNEAEAAS